MGLALKRQMGRDLTHTRKECIFHILSLWRGFNWVVRGHPLNPHFGVSAVSGNTILDARRIGIDSIGGKDIRSPPIEKFAAVEVRLRLAWTGLWAGALRSRF